MPLQHTVIIGAGQAGIQVADSLRAEGYAGAITLVSNESPLPYQRPQLSKDFLAADPGAADAEALPLRSEAFFTDNDIGLLRGIAVMSIDAEARRIRLSTGEYLDYTDLVVATGTRARQLPVPGARLAGVHTIRTLEDSLALREELHGASRMIVIGAGFIGLEVAAVARALGVEVTVLPGPTPPMARAVSRAMSAWFSDFHRAHGVTLRDSETAVELQGRGGRVYQVVSDTGRRYDADVVVVGIGAIPNVEMVERTGVVDTDRGGVAVDRYLRTSRPGIWALGDCATFPSGPAGTPTRIESVQNATDQGRLLARNLIAAHRGERLTRYSPVAWFWSHQGAAKLQIAGLCDRDAVTTLPLGDPAAGKFSVLCFNADEELVAVESVNSPGEHMAARRLLARTDAVTKAEASSPGFCLKKRSRQELVPV